MLSFKINKLKINKTVFWAVVSLLILALATFFIFQYINRAPIPPTNQAQSIREEVLKEDPGATLIENGENYLKFRLSDGQYRLVSSMGGLYTKDGLEIDTALKTSLSEGWSASISKSLSEKWIVQTGPNLDYVLQFQKDGTRRYTPRKDYPNEYMETGALQYLDDDEWKTLPLGSAKVEGNSIIWDRPTYTLGYFAGVDKVKMNFILKRESAEHPIRWPITFNNLTLRADDDMVSNTDGQVVTTFLPPFWYDAREQSSGIDWSAEGGYIYFDIKLPDDIVYPVTVDPSVSKSNEGLTDDGSGYIQCNVSYALFSACASYGGISIGGNSTCGDGRVSGYSPWFRFAHIPISKNSTITAASITVVAAAAGSSGTVSEKIFGVAEDNHVAPTTGDEWIIDHNMHTTASTTWDIGVWVAGTAYTSPDITTTIQEIVGRSGWQRDNAIGIHLDAFGYSTGYSRTLAAYDHYSYAEPKLDVTYNELPYVSVGESSYSTNVVEGGATDTYTVVLATQPSADVVVTISNDAQVSKDKSSLTFTSANWSTSQTVTVTAVNDTTQESSPHSGAITHSAASSDSNYNGIVVKGVTANITDNDTPSVIRSANFSGTMALTEGATPPTWTNLYSLRLGCQPTANVVISINEDSQVNASPASFTFTTSNWNTGQTVTVLPVDDSIAEYTPHISTIAHPASSSDPRYNGFAIPSETINITDNDSPGINVSP